MKRINKHSGILHMGRAAYELLDKNQGRIMLHSVFTRAVNIITEEELLITVLPQGMSCGTQTVIMSTECFQWFMLQYCHRKNNEAIRVLEGLGDTLIMDLSMPEHIYSQSLPLYRQEIGQNLQYLKNKAAKEGAAGFLFGGDAPVACGLRTKLAGLEVLLHKRSGRKLALLLSGALGLGPGLTPSSDDFIYGLLAALFYDDKAKQQDYGWVSQAAELIAEAARAKTTIISYNMLRSCIAGEFTQWVRDYVLSLINCSKSIEALNKVLAIGSSSGTDIAAGILYGLKNLTVKED